MRPTERLELEAFRDMFRAVPAAIAEQVGAAHMEVGGALAICTSRVPGRETNRIMGLERIESLDSLDAFFRERGVQYVVGLDLETGLAPELEARGYTPGYAWTKFGRSVEAPPEILTDLRVELVGAGRGSDVGRTFTEGYGMPAALAPWFGSLPGRDGWSWFVAYAGDEPAATGSLWVSGDTGWLGAAATRPEFRRRGAQGAILAARIRRAAELGVTSLVTETGELVEGRPANSYRNILRAGFEPVYVRPNYVSPGSPAESAPQTDDQSS